MIKRSKRIDFYTRDPNEERPSPGLQLNVADNFSENIFEKVIRELVECGKNPSKIYDPDLPNPHLEYMELLSKSLGRFESLADSIDCMRKSITGYNLKLSECYKSHLVYPTVTDETSKDSEKSLENTQIDTQSQPLLITEPPNIVKKQMAAEPLETQVLDRTLSVQGQIEEEMKDSYSYINCDVRYFNFEYLTTKLGNFDILLVDPPWRIKGGQKNDSQFMFSNSSFCLEYNTMSNSEIMNLPLEKLSSKGFIFLWILANQVDCCVAILEKWGYTLIDLIMWVKLKEGKIWLSHGYYLMHSYEICLVGYKCPPREHVEFYSKVSNNIIFGEVRGKSQKPDELYELIDLMMPGAKKVEIFARNNNIRPGWFALGNQLGPQFGKWRNLVQCDGCGGPLDASSKARYKSKKTANFDLCPKCFKQDDKLVETDFFKLNTVIQEDILHYYRTCNLCNTEPIWGVRFSRTDEPDFDICEGTLVLRKLVMIETSKVPTVRNWSLSTSSRPMKCQS